MSISTSYQIISNPKKTYYHIGLCMTMGRDPTASTGSFGEATEVTLVAPNTYRVYFNQNWTIGAGKMVAPASHLHYHSEF